MIQMGWDDRQQAYSTLRVGLHTLGERLIVDEAVDLGARLPLLVRGFYYENWRPAGKLLMLLMVSRIHRDEFPNRKSSRQE